MRKSEKFRISGKLIAKYLRAKKNGVVKTPITKFVNLAVANELDRQIKLNPISHSNLYHVLTDRGMTWLELAEKTGIDQKQIAKLHNGYGEIKYRSGIKIGRPKPAVLKIARALKCSLHDIFPMHFRKRNKNTATKI